ncbi:hypothetical protein C0J52_07965 [Blattella germanica]|nr:hypothetical protein C0J52_07965 [Blattella germanica]PSN51098.1 hypothetical protein C0J52_07965 [Blattella germanica]
MSRIFQPLQLEQLSLVTFGNYIYKIGHDILGQPDADLQIYEYCKKVHGILESGVPPRLADRITSYLITRVEELSSIQQKGHKLKLVKQALLGAIIHPASTKLNLSTCIPSWLPTLKLLTELRVDSMFLKFNENVFIFALYSMNLLQVFCYSWFCTNKILDTLAKWCFHLRVLEISGSKKVTNKSVSSILQLKKLEQLELFNTRIHGKGITKILQGLNTTILTSFSCNNINKCQFKLMTNNMPKIKTLKFQTKKCDIVTLKDFTEVKNLGLFRVDMKRSDFNVVDIRPDSFRHLKVLSLTKMKFSSVFTLLYEVGSRISELTLHEVKYISAIAIAETCPVLRVLKIVDCYEDGCAKMLWKSCNGASRSLFQSVEEVVIHLEDDIYFIIFVLSCCTNVKKVDVGLFGDDTEEDFNCPDILESILMVNRLSQLEEFHTMQFLKEEVIKRTVEQCPKLSLITGKL